VPPVSEDNPTRHSVVFGHFHSNSRRKAHRASCNCAAQMKIGTARQVSGRVVRCQILRKFRVVAACLFCVCRFTD
jgi:hypothetical protein